MSARGCPPLLYHSLGARLSVSGSLPSSSCSTLLTVSIGIDTASTQEITEGSGADDMGLRQVREDDAADGGWPAARRRR